MQSSSRAYHHGDLGRALLDAAQAIVAESGVDAVTMSAVAKRSGVSSGAPYRHFKDRFELLRALSERAQERLAERTLAAVAGAPTAIEGFRRSGVAYVRFAIDEPALFTVLSRGELTVRDSDGPRNPADVRFTAALAELLGGDPQAPLDPRDPVIQELAARCMMHGLAHFVVDGMLDVVGVAKEQGERIAEALTRSLGPPTMIDEG
ncbi:MAG: TetR/AcrR family transcriptional regulator [Nannocystaceae bacterium]